MMEKGKSAIFYFFPGLCLILFIFYFSLGRNSPFKDEEVESFQSEVDEGAFGMSEETSEV